MLFRSVGAHASDVGSANWHASAALIARYCREALLIDMGSTTTDIIRGTAGDRGTRLRRPRAELGIREREPGALPPEA